MISPQNTKNWVTVLFPSSFEPTLKRIKSIILSTKNMNRLYQIICQYFKCDQIGLQQAIRMCQLYHIHKYPTISNHSQNSIYYSFRSNLNFIFLFHFYFSSLNELNVSCQLYSLATSLVPWRRDWLPHFFHLHLCMK